MLIIRRFVNEVDQFLHWHFAEASVADVQTGRRNKRLARAGAMASGLVAESYLASHAGWAALNDVGQATLVVLNCVREWVEGYCYDVLAKEWPESKSALMQAAAYIQSEADAITAHLDRATPLFTLEENHVNILTALKRHSPRLLKLDELAIESDISPRSVKRHIAYLIQHGLVVRPGGPRSRRGVTITDQGAKTLA
jgi:DNA-binding MarR family transcriptional regulator